MAEEYTAAPAEILRSWMIDRICRRSDLLLQQFKNEEETPQRELNRVSGWSKFVRTYAERSAEDLRYDKGLLLTGPVGCGKHTAAMEAVSYLTDENKRCYDFENEAPFELLYVSGTDLSAPGASPEEYMDCLLETFLKSGNGGVCLVLEYPEAHPELLEHLGYSMISFRYTAETNPLFLIVLSRDENAIPPVLRSQLHVCRMGLPDRTKRELFWQCAADIEPNVSRWMEESTPERTPEELAEETSGMNYRQLSDLVRTIVWAVESGDDHTITLGEEQLYNEIQRNRSYTDTKQIMYERITEFLEQIPELSDKFLEAIRSISVTTGGGQQIRSEQDGNESRNPVEDVFCKFRDFLNPAADVNKMELSQAGFEGLWDREKIRQETYKKTPDQIMQEVEAFESVSQTPELEQKQ